MFVSKAPMGYFRAPWFCHIDADGREAKPFVLPQKNPDFYNQWLLNYNRPEFISGKVEVTPVKLSNLLPIIRPQRFGLIPLFMPRPLQVQPSPGKYRICFHIIPLGVMLFNL
jgi:hypothetical protein